MSSLRPRWIGAAATLTLLSWSTRPFAQSASGPAPAPSVQVPECDSPETCPPPPPYAPPVHGAQTEAATRARYEAEARVRRDAEVRNGIASAIDEERRHLWIERGRLPERDPVPLGWPLLSPSLMGGGDAGAAFARRDAGTWVVSGGAALRFMPQPRWGVDVGAGMMALAPEQDARYRALTIDGGAAACSGAVADARALHTSIYCARGGLQLGLPIEGGAHTPDALLGIKASFAATVFVARFGDGGFAAVALDVGAVLRVPIGGEPSPARFVTAGPQLLVGTQVAF